MDGEGIVLHNTPIAVDTWKQLPGVRLYFLTHCHADHCSGLMSSWRAGHIYCSEISKALLIHKYNIDSSLITALEVGERHMIPLCDSGKHTMSVTVIDANHCPGAVMFLFEGYFGTVLCTGDFRYDSSQLYALRGVEVDHMYLDNTYCNPQCRHPSRDLALRQLFRIVDDHPDHDVLLGMDTLGKEDVLLALAERYKAAVHVSEPQLKTYRAAGVQANIFTTQPEDSRFHVVSRHQLSTRFVEAYAIQPCVGVVLSAFDPELMASLNQNPTAKAASSAQRKRVHRVPYSLHCSFDELQMFVRTIGPKTLVPLVRSAAVDPLPHFRDVLAGSNAPSLHEVKAPPAVEAFMARRGTTSLAVRTAAALRHRRSNGGGAIRGTAANNSNSNSSSSSSSRRHSTTRSAGAGGGAVGGMRRVASKGDVSGKFRYRSKATGVVFDGSMDTESNEDGGGEPEGTEQEEDEEEYEHVEESEGKGEEEEADAMARRSSEGDMEPEDDEKEEDHQMETDDSDDAVGSEAWGAREVRTSAPFATTPKRSSDTAGTTTTTTTATNSSSSSIHEQLNALAPPDPHSQEQRTAAERGGSDAPKKKQQQQQQPAWMRKRRQASGVWSRRRIGSKRAKQSTTTTTAARANAAREAGAERGGGASTASFSSTTPLRGGVKLSVRRTIAPSAAASVGCPFMDSTDGDDDDSGHGGCGDGVPGRAAAHGSEPVVDRERGSHTAEESGKEGRELTLHFSTLTCHKCTQVYFGNRPEGGLMLMIRGCDSACPCRRGGAPARSCLVPLSSVLSRESCLSFFPPTTQDINSNSSSSSSRDGNGGSVCGAGWGEGAACNSDVCGEGAWLNTGGAAPSPFSSPSSLSCRQEPAARTAVDRRFQSPGRFRQFAAVVAKRRLAATGGRTSTAGGGGKVAEAGKENTKGHRLAASSRRWHEHEAEEGGNEANRKEERQEDDEEQQEKEEQEEADEREKPRGEPRDENFGPFPVHVSGIGTKQSGDLGAQCTAAETVSTWAFDTQAA